MARLYRMSVEVSKHDWGKVAEIHQATECEWPFDDWWSSTGNDNAVTIHAAGEDYLFGGESEEEFAERLTLAIWRANGGFCRVIVNATYLEELPYEKHELDETDYARLILGST